MNSLWGPIIGIVCIGFFALVFVIVGIVMIVRSQRDKAKMHQAQNWPSVDGTVIESRVITSTSSDDEGGSDM
ncbi:DUF3592 domain-containing protein [bacterium]|nr:DUF3592 domain-containing protein [bacterium]